MCFWKKKKKKSDEIYQNTSYAGTQNVCSNCGIAYGEGDTFCRYCGTARVNYPAQTLGQPAADTFQPNANMGENVYGPPLIERVHTCVKCGHKWEDYGQDNNGDSYCPICGNKA